VALTLLAVRHAPTDADGLCVGRHDVPTHLTHAAAADAMLEALGGATPTWVWSSPVSRCREPAAIVAARLRVPHRIDPRVHELSYGAWEGRAWSALEREDGAQLAAWMEAWRSAAPPGGESVPQLEARVREWAQQLDASTHLLVAHAGVIRASRVIAGATWDDAMSAPVPHLERLTFSLG
jgi:alpha-ribazole phosphatase